MKVVPRKDYMPKRPDPNSIPVKEVRRLFNKLVEQGVFNDPNPGATAERAASECSAKASGSPP